MNPELRRQKILEMTNVCEGLSFVDAIELISLGLVTLIHSTVKEDGDKLDLARMSGNYIYSQTEKLIESKDKSNEKA